MFFNPCLSCRVLEKAIFSQQILQALGTDFLMKSSTCYEQVGGYSLVVFSLRPAVIIFELFKNKQLKLPPA